MCGYAVFTVDINYNCIAVYVEPENTVYLFYTREKTILDSYLHRYRKKIQSIADVSIRSRLYWEYREKAYRVVDTIRRRLYTRFGQLVKKHKPVVLVLENLYWSGYGLYDSWYQWNPCQIQSILAAIVKRAGGDVVYIDPRHTSTTCPVCGNTLVPGENRLMKCSVCGYTGNRDVVAVLNLYKRYTQRKPDTETVKIKAIRLI